MRPHRPKHKVTELNTLNHSAVFHYGYLHVLLFAIELVKCVLIIKYTTITIHTTTYPCRVSHKH